MPGGTRRRGGRRGSGSSFFHRATGALAGDATVRGDRSGAPPANGDAGDGDRVGGLLCVHLPGRTPGGIGLLDEGSAVLFCGDTLRFDASSIGRGPARFNMNPVRERESILRMAELDFDNLLIGHGVPLLPDASARVGEFAKGLPPVRSHGERGPIGT